MSKKKKATIHPDYDKTEVVMTNGDVFYTRSTYGGKSGAKKLVLEIDKTTHPAWNKDKANFLNERDDNVKNFKKRYESLEGIM